MDKDEILKEYTDELSKKPDLYEGILNEWGTSFFYEKHIKVRDDLHRTAMTCLNKFLPPELKIFLKNLCSNQLGYPDEMIFYKVFGDDPEIGKSVSKAELEKKGIDINEFEKMIEWWGWEGTFVEKQSYNDIEYYYLESLCERGDITSEEETERLNASVELKKAIFEQEMSFDKEDELIEHIDTLLHGVNPEKLKQKKLKKIAQEILDNTELYSSLSKDAQDYFRNISTL